MVFQRNRDVQQESFETGLPPAQSGEDVPRWLVILGMAAGLTLLVALLRYAVDLLGVVFVIILVGFAIRALSDWLTEGESISGWAMSALSLGLMGSVLVGLWLFSSRDLEAPSIGGRLPGPIQSTVSWLEHHGWGQRVLLPGGSGSGALAGGGARVAASDSAPVGEASDASAPVTMSPQPRATPSLPANGPNASVRSRPQSARRAAPDEAEAAPPAQPAGAPSAGVPAAPQPAVVPTSVTLTASPARAVVGRSVRLIAEVSALGAGTSPTGTVTFSADDGMLGRAPVRNGTAVLVTLQLAIGDHMLSAVYEGDDAHLPSRSASIAQAVARK